MSGFYGRDRTPGRAVASLVALAIFVSLFVVAAVAPILGMH